MMFTKRYNNKLDKEELKKFAITFSKGDYDFVNINNLLQKSYAVLSQGLDKYLDFYSEEANDLYKTRIIKDIVKEYEVRALKESFGNFDFIYEGVEKIENYVLSYDTFIIVGPEKMCVCESGYRSDLLTEEYLDKVIGLEKAYHAFVLDYVFKKENVKKSVKEDIEELKKLGVIGLNGEIDYSVTKDLKLKKPFASYKKVFAR